MSQCVSTVITGTPGWSKKLLSTGPAPGIAETKSTPVDAFSKPVDRSPDIGEGRRGTCSAPTNSRSCATSPPLFVHDRRVDTAHLGTQRPWASRDAAGVGRGVERHNAIPSNGWEQSAPGFRLLRIHHLRRHPGGKAFAQPDIVPIRPSSPDCRTTGGPSSCVIVDRIWRLCSRQVLIGLDQQIPLPIGNQTGILDRSESAFDQRQMVELIERIRNPRIFFKLCEQLWRGGALLAASDARPRGVTMRIGRSILPGWPGVNDVERPYGKGDQPPMAAAR